MTAKRSDAPRLTHCPANHKLPHRGPKGECTPLYCANPTKSYKGKKELPTPIPAELPKDTKADAVVRSTLIELSHEPVVLPGKLDMDPTLKTAANTGRDEALEKISYAAGRYNARKQFFKPPEGLSPEDTEKWFDQKVMGLLPDALAEHEYQLKFGNDEQRRDASNAILDMAGKRKKDAALGGQQTIILNMNGIKLPFTDKPIINAVALPEGKKNETK